MMFQFGKPPHMVESFILHYAGCGLGTAIILLVVSVIPVLTASNMI